MLNKKCWSAVTARNLRWVCSSKVFTDVVLIQPSVSWIVFYLYWLLVGAQENVEQPIQNLAVLYGAVRISQQHGQWHQRLAINSFVLMLWTFGQALECIYSLFANGIQYNTYRYPYKLCCWIWVSKWRPHLLIKVAALFLVEAEVPAGLLTPNDAGKVSRLIVMTIQFP